MFRIELLPAQRGDSIWISYGAEGDEHHVLIDAGPKDTIQTLVPALEERIAAIPGKTDRVELLIVTHIDADHIQGVVSLLSDPERVPLFRDVWFNGWEQLPTLGAGDAEQLTGLLDQHRDHWNRAFDGGAVMIPAMGDLPVVKLRGGMCITLLAPDEPALAKLVPEWRKWCKKAGIAPGQGAPITRKSAIRDGLLGFDADVLAKFPFRSDGSVPNCAGIACIAEYDGKRVLLLADCPPKPVLRALDRLEPRPHRFDAVKVAHHGSRRNTDLEFAEAVQSPTWLVSTNGAVFQHPDPESIARIVIAQEHPPTFAFNYDTEFVRDIVERAGRRYKVRLPKKRRGVSEEGIVVSV